MKRAIVFMMVLAAGILSCKEKRVGSTGFLDEEQIGIYKEDATPIFLFDKTRNEVGILPAEMEFRVQDSDQNILFAAVLTDQPVLGSTINFTFTKGLMSGSVDSGLYTVKVVKAYDNYRWLWSESKKIGFLIYWDWE